MGHALSSCACSPCHYNACWHRHADWYCLAAARVSHQASISQVLAQHFLHLAMLTMMRVCNACCCETARSCFAIRCHAICHQACSVCAVPDMQATTVASSDLLRSLVQNRRSTARFSSTKAWVAASRHCRNSCAVYLLQLRPGVRTQLAVLCGAWYGRRGWLRLYHCHSGSEWHTFVKL